MAHPSTRQSARSPHGLAQQFPGLSAEDIDRAVTGHYDAFAHSPIRDFVPVLVERAARQQLTEDCTRRRG